MKTIVTGGSGFIGSHVVDALLAARHEVVVYDLEPPHRKDAAWVDGDICDSLTLLRAAQGADVVFHLAACSDVNDVLRIPAQAVRINVFGTACVLDVAKAVGARVVFESTDWVYRAVRNEVCVFTGHPYTSTKLAGEMLCHNYAALYGVPFTILRTSTPYGPRMRESMMIPQFVRRAEVGGPIIVHGDGVQERYLVYIGDVARAHVMALEKRNIGQTHDVRGMLPVKVQEVAETVRALLTPNVKIEHDEPRQGDYESLARRGALMPGWVPEVGFVEGLKRTVVWLLRGESNENH